MHAAYAIIYVTPVVILTLAAIGVVCYITGQLRAAYLWNKVDREHDTVDTCSYYVTMLFASNSALLSETEEEEAAAPSLEELADMASDLAETASVEYDEWVTALDADIEYQEREERRRRLIRNHSPSQVTFSDIILHGTSMGIGAVG